MAVTRHEIALDRILFNVGTVVVGMNALVLQFSSSLIEMGFTLALVAGGLLLVGVLVSLLVFAYRSVLGDGPKDPREVAPEKTKDDDNGLREGDQNDEWDYY